MSKKIFISYAWSDANQVDQIDSQFSRFNIELTRDIRDLKYNANIRKFMDSISKHDKVILYVSERYLKSVNCMYEACLSMQDSEKYIIILDKNLKIFTPEDKRRYIEHWHAKLNELAATYDNACFKEEIEDVRFISEKISDFINAIKEKNRMNHENLDFDVLFQQLEVERLYKKIITKEVLEWIKDHPQARLFDTLSLVHDLFKSKTICISEYPNIPDDEQFYRFREIAFSPNINGINIFLKLTSINRGNEITITYPATVGIEANSIRSDWHSKYYIVSEDANLKQQWTWIQKKHAFSSLSEEENRLLLNGYQNTYRITVNF